MSNSSEAARLLDAIARECSTMAGEIAALGAQVCAFARDDAAIVTLQRFDYLAQQAQAQSDLIARLANGMTDGHAISAAIDAIPLPHVRARLLGTPASEHLFPDGPDQDIFWV
jgi:hypothetical protein